MGALIATIFTVITLAVSSIFVSNELATRRSVSPNAPESKPAASGCSGTCRNNCNEDEKGSGTDGCSGGQYCCNSNGGSTPILQSGDNNSCAGPLSAAICKNKSVGDTVCVHNTLRCTRTTGTNCSAYDTGVQCEGFPTSTPEPTTTASPSNSVNTDSCGVGMVCSSKSKVLCLNSGGEASSCVNSSGNSGNCCSPTNLPSITPTASPTVSTTINTSACKKINEAPTSSIPCCSPLVKVVTPYGTYCGNKGECVTGNRKCQKEGVSYFEYLCDSSGYFQRDKRCDFGCNNNSCSTGGCVVGQTRCDPVRPNELETCTGTAWNGKSCDNGCETISSTKAQCKTISSCTNPAGTPGVTKICNNAGGYNYCSSDGNWYSRKCESEKPGSVCVSGQCVLPSPTASANAQIGKPSITPPTPTPTPPPTPTSTTQPTCNDQNKTWSEKIPCCSPLVKVVTPFGAYCGKQGDCQSGTKMCQKDAVSSFEYVCDSSGYFQKTKRCDFGCENNSCKSSETCVPNKETRCSPTTSTLLQTCSSDGTAWSGTYCPNGCQTIEGVSSCKATVCENPYGQVNDQICNTAGGYNFCSTSGEWYSKKCPEDQVCPIGGKECVSQQQTEWHFSCSLSGDFAMYVNNGNLGIDWSKSKRCEDGCENGECKGGVKTTCSEGEYSLDKFEKCVNSEWQCVPGQSRRLSAPGQSNISELITKCDDNHQTYTTGIEYRALEALSCNKNNLIDGDKKVVVTCSSDEKCLDAGKYSFIEFAGCYRDDFIKANICTNGEKKSPTQPYECEYVCKGGSWKFSEPLVCMRDPNIVEEIICDNAGSGRVLQGDKVLQVCNNGCSYGKCLPLEEALCNSNDGYLSGNPPCLVACVDGKYQTTQICSSALEIKQDNWNNQDLLVLFQSISRFPNSLKDTIFEIEFIRLEQAVAMCSEDGCAAGYYSNSNGGFIANILGSINLPDAGINQETIDHELIHAIDDSDPALMREFVKATGCSQNPADPNGAYTYSETPYREYGETNCVEGLAVGCGEEYMNPQMSCNMKTARPNTYNYCKDNVFSGTEYCE